MRSSLDEHELADCDVDEDAAAVHRCERSHGAELELRIRGGEHVLGRQVTGFTEDVSSSIVFATFERSTPNASASAAAVSVRECLISSYRMSAASSASSNCLGAVCRCMLMSSHLLAAERVVGSGYVLVIAPEPVTLVATCSGSPA